MIVKKEKTRNNACFHVPTSVRRFIKSTVSSWRSRAVSSFSCLTRSVVKTIILQMICVAATQRALGAAQAVRAARQMLLHILRA